MESIQITNVSVNSNRVDIDFRVSPGIEKYFLPEHHFFTEYTFDVSNVPESVLITPILLNLLPFSWITDSVIWVNEIVFNR